MIATVVGVVIIVAVLCCFCW